MIERLRNIAIVAHVDHGKTTLVDKLLAQSGTLDRKNQDTDRILDSNDQERERGITILAKNTAIHWNGYHINIVDTPGHADFGGEVERVLSMVDSVLLLVDAVEGPMPQTRFVTQKAFEHGLSPIVVVNKVDRHRARPNWVVDQIFDLFDRLGANEKQLDFPILYTSATNGIAGTEIDSLADDMTPLFQAIVDEVAPPQVDIAGPLQLQISALDYSSYVGVIGIGRIARGSLNTNKAVTIVNSKGTRRARVLQVMGHLGLERIEVEHAHAGDIVCVTGIDDLHIGDTLCNPEHPEGLPTLSVDEPTITMTFRVNDSPFAGRDGKFIASRQLKERLERELLHNVALRVEPGDGPDRFTVSGRGELHLSVLIENMRREGFEIGISRPEVIIRTENGMKQEPYEHLVIDCEDQHQGPIIEMLGKRCGELRDLVPDGKGRVRLEYQIPVRGLIGFRTQFLSTTSGKGLMTHTFDHYGPYRAEAAVRRNNGVLISMAKGKVLGFALFHLQERGRLILSPGMEVYEGMIAGIHSRSNDLTVNPTKAKKLDNMRSATADDNILLKPPVNLSLEQALEFIEEDELVEVTPKAIRLRKKLLFESERRRAYKT